MKIKYSLLTFLILVSQCFYATSSISIGLTVFGAIGAALYQSYDKFIGCSFSECCSQKIGSNWIPANITGLQKAIETQLYGQHLVEDIVVRAVRGHLTNNSPSKALVMSFHGWTGSGKNYVARFIAENLYKKGLKSKFVHLFVSTVNFPHEDKIDIYKLQIQDWIRGNVSECPVSLFIFDEIDKMPVGMIDAIKPFIDYHDNIFGVDFRKSIFIFLSNTGSREINRAMLKLWREQKAREDITLKDMEDLVQRGAFNEEGGLHNSDLIQHSLVDFYVPFLPLERKHVELCARDELLKRGAKPSAQTIRDVLDVLVFFPPENQLYSSTGCKRVAQRTAYILADKNYDNMFE